MIDDWLGLAPMIVTIVAVVRVGWVLLGHARTFLNRFRRLRFQLSTIEVATMPEPLLMAAIVACRGVFEPTRDGGTPLVALGLVASLAGLAVSLAAFASFPTVGTGHYVDSGQRVVRRGIYGWVRHPIYLGVFLIWIGLALGCRSPVAGIATALYVIPVYLAYIRSEERMMCAHFGDAYRRYAIEVGGLWPRRACCSPEGCPRRL
jgi:protein-S-isoprenylcysteine O-methyltransferase Ste14